MLRIFLLITGYTVFIIQHYIMPVPPYWQQIYFLSGIILLGIPHGAADMLVAAQNAGNMNKTFSVKKFLCAYLLRLILFGLLIWLFPLAGVFLFVFFAAYHFGETDLYLFKTDQWPGKLVVISYRLVILNVILFNNLAELKELLEQAGIVRGKEFINGWATQHRLAVLTFSLLLFFCSIFSYFLFTTNREFMPDGFLTQFALLVLLLYNLPLVTGFTFYFVVWHAVLSLRNIVVYLKKNQRYTYASIARQISIYSGLAIAGISIAGITGIVLLNRQGIMMSVFAGLAVLTAPHMQVMHDMYTHIRISKK